MYDTNWEHKLDWLNFGCLNRLCHCRSGKRSNGGLRRRYSLRMAAFSEKKRNRQQPLDGFGILWKEENGLVTTAQASDSAKAGNYSGGGEERACHSPTPGAATRPRPSWVKLWPVNTGKARGNTFATESWCPWLPPRWTHLEGGRRSGGSWTRAAASAASAWAATWSSGASSRSGWASPCTRSSLSSCWTGTLLQAVCSVRVLSLCPPRVCSIWCSCLMPTAESAAWCRGFGGPGAKMGGLCGSALQATPSPGAPLQAPYLQRSPSQCPVQILPREAGARRPGAGWSLQVWNLSMMRGLRRPGCPGEVGSGRERIDSGEQAGEGAEPEASLPWSSREVVPLLETFPTPGEEREEEDEDEEEMLSDASPWTYSSSPDDDPDAPRVLPSPVTHALEGETSPAPAAPLNPLAVPSSSTSSMGSGALLPTEVGVQPELRGTPQAAQQTEPLASPGSQAQSALTLAWEEDTAQIGPKRIRKAAKRELLPCDFPGCGRIFSNRQYLNHHKKYQHIHQKSFSCPEPACGKSFNFKKHLKEHVKLHSDTRDYICEFCARSFRTSSNLVIHRRIHTGEKPLQCEICGFTCRQKASLNWHRRKHAETAATLRFPCEFCGKRFEKPDSVAAHCSKSHPALLPAPQESPGPLEPCPSISASVTLRSGDESRPSVVPQALTVLPQQ
ncbi:zinc finger protein 692 isoform X2 [Callorhinus ursinus]|uniref:zinc finger protein 692 isoform X2 n=1 Tax=Callorhinus ursinus TaxID=34884 RepID=UPI003CD04819